MPANLFNHYSVASKSSGTGLYMTFSIFSATESVCASSKTSKFCSVADSVSVMTGGCHEISIVGTSYSCLASSLGSSVVIMLVM